MVFSHFQEDLFAIQDPDGDKAESRKQNRVRECGQAGVGDIAERLRGGSVSDTTDDRAAAIMEEVRRASSRMGALSPPLMEMPPTLIIAESTEI